MCVFMEYHVSKMHTMPRHYMYKCRHDQMQPFERCQKISQTPLNIYKKLQKEKAEVFLGHQFSCAFAVSFREPEKNHRFLLEKEVWKIHHLPNLHDFGFQVSGHPGGCCCCHPGGRSRTAMQLGKLGTSHGSPGRCQGLASGRNP